MRRRRLSGLPYTLAMGAAKQVRPLTLEEYLALEREAPVKHELVEGFPTPWPGRATGTTGWW